MTKYIDFYNMVLGKGYDIDGYYGWQCWDGYAEYCNWLKVPYAHCGIHGYACDVWEQRQTNGILNYFNETDIMQPGDVAVFKRINPTPLSHIAIFHSDIDGSYGWFLGQNQGGAVKSAAGGSCFNLCKLPYSATFDTAFRPKSMANVGNTSANTFDKKALIEEHAKATFTVDKVNARVNGPTGTVCRQYNSGQTVEYRYKWVGSGHRYICWYEGNNLIMVAVSATEDYNSDRWAIISAIEATSSPTTKPEPVKPNKDLPENMNGFTTVEDGQIEDPSMSDEIFEDSLVKVDLISKDLYPYKCPYTMKAKTIVVHNAATPNGTAQALNATLHSSKEYKSWHFSVDNKEIIESLPINRNAFATGDGGCGVGNRSGIQIEIAKDMDGDSTDDWKRSKENGALLVAKLLKKYGWGIEHVSKHQDYKMTDGTYKYCPHKILDEGWEDFLNLIQSELDALNEQKSDGNSSEDKPDSKVDSSDIKETNSLLKLLIQLLKKIFNIK